MQAPEDQILALYRRWWVTTERRSPDTVDHYLCELRQLSDTAGRPLLDLDRLTIEDWIAERTERSSHTGRWAFRAARSFYRWACDRESIDTDPTEKITSPKEVKNPTPNTIIVEAFEHLISTIEGDGPFAVRDRAIIETLWATGLRRGELLRMERHCCVGRSRIVARPTRPTDGERRSCLSRTNGIASEAPRAVVDSRNHLAMAQCNSAARGR